MNDESKLLTGIGLKRGMFRSLVDSGCSRNYPLKLNDIQACPKHTSLSFALEFTIGDVAAAPSFPWSILTTYGCKITVNACKFKRPWQQPINNLKDLQGVKRFKRFQKFEIVVRIMLNRWHNLPSMDLGELSVLPSHRCTCFLMLSRSAATARLEKKQKSWVVS